MYKTVNNMPLLGKRVFIIPSDKKGCTIASQVLELGGEVINDHSLLDNVDVFVFSCYRDVLNFTAITGCSLKNKNVCSADIKASAYLLQHSIFPFMAPKSNSITDVMESITELCS